MISVLYVDDEPDLLEVAQLFLERTGEFRVVTSTSAKEILNSPQIPSYDAIVSDYQMPEMDGIAFLKAVRERFGDIPFILFTGRGREEVVIEALNNGADFYLQKGGAPQAQFAELTNKIRYAVSRKRAEKELQRKNDELNASYEQIAANEEELRQQLDELMGKQEALKRSEERFRAFTEKIPDLTTISDTKGVYTYVSPSIRQILGRSADELLGKTYDVIETAFGILPDAAKNIRECGQIAIQKPGEAILVPSFQAHDFTGRALFLEGTVTYLPGVEGIQGLLFHGRDITDRVKAEEEIVKKSKELMQSFEQLAASEEELRGQYEELALGEKRIRESEGKFRTLFETIHEALIVYTGRQFTDCNQLALVLFGYESKEEFLQVRPSDIFPPFQPDGQDSGLAGKTHFQTALREGSDHFEWVHKKKDGGLFPSDVLLSQFELDGKRMVLASIRDISDRKRIEDELRLLKISVDRSSDEVFWLDFNGSIRYVNDAACRATGYSREELCSMKLFELDPDFPPDVWDASVADLRQKKTQFISTRHKRKDGSIMDVEIVTVYVNRNNLEYSFAFVRDITDMKIADRKIQDNAAFLNALIEQNPNPMWISDDKGFLVRMNAACSRMLHSSEAELAGKYNILEDNIVEQQGFMPLVRSVFEEGEVVHFPLVYDSSLLCTIPMKEPVSIVLEVTIFPVRNTGGKITNAVIIHNDVSDRARTEQVLAESEEKYRSLIELSPIAVGVHRNGKILYLNPEAVRLLKAKTAEDLIGKDVLSFIHPDEHVRAREDFRQLYEEGKTIALQEERLLTVDGEPFTVEVAAARIQYEGLASVLVVFRDISERIRGQEALRESEENYRSLIEFAPVAIVVHRNGKNVYANPEAVRMVKADSIEDIIGKDIRTFVSPEHRARTLEAARMMTEENRALPRQEQHVVAVDGEVLTVEVAAKPISFQGLPSIMVLMRDITKRKKAEEQLFSSQQMLQTVLDTIPQRVFWKDKNSVFLGCNRQNARDAGFSDPSDMVGKTDFDYTTKEVAELYRADDQRVMETGQGRVNYEEPQVRTDGSTAWLRTSKVPLRDKEGTITGILGTYEDITGYRKNAEALRESEEKYRTLVENAREIIAIVQDWNILFINRKGIEILGIPETEIVGRPFLDFIWPEDVELLKKYHIAREAGNEAPEAYDYRIRGAGGRPVWVFSSIARITWQGKPAIISLMTDITERKFAEAALKDSEETFRNVIEGAPEAIYIGADWKFLYLNPAAIRLFGATSGDQLIGKQFMDFIHPRFHEAVKNRVLGLYDERVAAPSLEEVYLRLDGTAIEVEVSAVPFTYQGQSGSLVFVWNISDRKRAERARRQSEETYRRILESMQDAYISTDRDGRITLVNPSAARMFGYGSPPEMIGLPMDSLYLHPDTRDAVIKKLREEGKISDSAEMMRHRDGTSFWVSLSIQLAKGDDGTITGAEGIIRDITERKAMEQAVREANKKLNLLSSITRHDVANQLTVLQGFAQLAAIRSGDPVTADFLSKIGAAADTITKQIEFTKTYEDLGLQTPAWFRFEEIFEKTARPEVLFSNTCRTMEIFADPMLERVFFNLFENAARHGEHVTSISVRCERAPDGLVVIIEDDGVGIAPELKERIFEKGFGKNTGFGLFLAREILAITGITIRETGYLGVGARFEITVPKERWRVAGQ